MGPRESHLGCQRPPLPRAVRAPRGGVSRLSPPADEAADDARRRRVAGILDVRLEGHAEDADLRALHRPAPVVEPLRDEVDDMARHAEVDVAGELDEAIRELELAGPPGQVI